MIVYCILCPFLEVISQKGLDHVTVESLVEDITPRARGIMCAVQQLIACFKMCCIASVPDYVKKELLQQIRDYLDKNS